MTKTACLALLPLLAACGGDAGAEGERKTAAGEVLGGTISDDMLPLDTVTSRSPPLREANGKAGEDGEETPGETAETVDAAQPTPGPAPVEQAPAAPRPAEPSPSPDDE